MSCGGAGEVVVRLVSNKAVLGRFARRQMPGGGCRWGNVRFLVDDEDGEYDWLVVYHDLPARLAEFEVKCPRARSVFVTHEPSAIKSYGSVFVRQFGWLLSCHEAWALPHPRRIAMQPGSIWIYGAEFYDESARGRFEWDMLRAAAAPVKTKTLSTVCSDKAMRHTMHYRRFHFTRRLAAVMPEMDVFGHGVNLLAQKADALDPYAYHLAVENAVCPDYWTEKLADAFLGWTLPFYCGCPNAADYFPEESFIPIDVTDFDGARETIARAIADGEYARRFEFVREARRRVLEEHNLYAMLARVVGGLPRDEGGTVPWVARSRYGLMRRRPWTVAAHLGQKMYNRVRRGAAALKK